MGNRKVSNKYYFSVEGETERWYLEWLRDQINVTDEAAFRISLDCKIEKNPLSRAKGMINTGKVVIYHLSDYESSEAVHERQFKDVMDQMHESTKLGKGIKYRFGYSNYTFDLWIALHKQDCNAFQTHRKKYISFINKAFGENFENLDAYKHEKAFKRCLGQLSLDDVKRAIERSNEIMQRNKDNGYVLHQYRGFSYYTENPSLAVHEAIGKIMKDCKLL